MSFCFFPNTENIQVKKKKSFPLLIIFKYALKQKKTKSKQERKQNTPNKNLIEEERNPLDLHVNRANYQDDFQITQKLV